MAFALNPDLSPALQIPGVYVFLSRAGAAPPATNRRVLLLGYKTSAGSKPAGTPLRILSEDDIVSFCGTGSDLHRMFVSFTAQNASTGADIWAMPMTAPSGTAQTRLITFLASPSGAALNATDTAALAPGIVTVWVCGQRYDTQVASGDTYAQIATNVCATIQANQGMLPCTASVASATVTLTARHAALTSADLPVIVTFSNTSMGVSASPGTLTYATTAAAGGSTTLGVSTQAVSASIANGATAAVTAAALITAVNAANAFPLRAAQTAPSAEVTLFYVDDRVFNWNWASVTTATTTTITPAWGANAAGLPSAASPSLSTVLTTLSAQEAYKLWLTPFSGAGATVATTGETLYGSSSDYTVLGTLSTHIEREGNGAICKGQILVLCDTRALAVAGSIPSGTSPALTLSPRYFVGWLPASPQQGYESAARMASIVMANIAYPPFNYAGQPLLTNSRVPYLVPSSVTRPSLSDCNSAMGTYFLTPLVANDSGVVEIMSGRTTAKPTAILDGDYRWWSVALADDFIRDDLRASMPAVIRGKSLKAYSEPRTQFTVTPDAIRTAIAARVVYYESLDIFDGDRDLAGALEVGINPNAPQRTDVKLPKRFPIPAEQISIVAQMAA